MSYQQEPNARAKEIQKAEQRARGLNSLAILRQSLGMTPLSDDSQVILEKLDAVFDGVTA